MHGGIGNRRPGFSANPLTDWNAAGVRRAGQAAAACLRAVRLSALLIAILAVPALTSCSDIAPPESSPTPEGPAFQARSTMVPASTLSPTPITPTATPTGQPSPTPIPPTATATAQPSPTPVPPTATPTSTPTPSPTPVPPTPTPRPLPTPTPTPVPYYWMEAWFEPPNIALGQEHRLCYRLRSNTPSAPIPPHVVRIWYLTYLLGEFWNFLSSGECYWGVAPRMPGSYLIEVEALVDGRPFAHTQVWLNVFTR
jgi:hypothetical protein